MLHTWPYIPIMHTTEGALVFFFFGAWVFTMLREFSVTLVSFTALRPQNTFSSFDFGFLPLNYHCCHSFWGVRSLIASYGQIGGSFAQGSCYSSFLSWTLTAVLYPFDFFFLFIIQTYTIIYLCTLLACNELLDLNKGGYPGHANQVAQELFITDEEWALPSRANDILGDHHL